MKRQRILGAAIALLVFCGCRTNPVTGDRELMLISDEAEVSLGQGAAPGMEEEFGGAWPDPALNRYVDGVGQSLVRASHRPNIPYSFRVLNSSQINAFALPGGPIYITRGLLVLLEDESQLAAVLGHEVGHVAARHGAKRLQNALGFQLLVTAALAYDASENGGQNHDEAQIAAQAGAAVFNLVQLGHGRDDELQSDELGADYAYRAGYDPRGMTGLLRILQQGDAGDPSAFEEFFRSHPATRRRIEDVERQIARKYPDAATNPSLRTERTAYASAVTDLRAAQVAYAKFDAAEKAQASGLLPQALSLYGEALRMRPGETAFQLGRGNTYLRQGNLGEAAKDYEACRARHPDCFGAQAGLSVVAFRRKDVIGARRHAEEAARLAPQNPLGHLLLGNALLGLGMKPEALEQYEVAQALDGKGRYTGAIRTGLQQAR